MHLSVMDLGSDIFDTPPPAMADKADSLRSSYGGIMDTYCRALGLVSISSAEWKKDFVTYATDLGNAAIWDSVKRVWPSLEPLRSGLEDAFRHYLYYFPGHQVPRVVACISSFNNSLIVDDSLLMISLDRYLGASSKYYPSLGIYSYQSRKMAPEYVVTDCMYGWASTEWNIDDMGYGSHNLLTVMMHEAKLEYFTRCMVPEASDTILFGFTQSQMRFCIDNEKRIWEYLVGNDMLFSTDSFIIRKMTGEAPFTSYFAEESPGRAVVWTGFRIIEAYMKNNPDVTLEKLMTVTDFQEILSGARYHP